jgi:hypothetical protein
MSQNSDRGCVGIPKTYLTPGELAPQLDPVGKPASYHDAGSVVEGSPLPGSSNGQDTRLLSGSNRAGSNPAPGTTEEWRPCVGWPNYEVSNLGQVRRRGRILKQTVFNKKTEGDGHYLGLCLSVEGVVTKVTVHSLVAAAFIGPRPEGWTIDHKDEVKSNNRATNLEYVTNGDNTRRWHARRLASQLAAGALTTAEVDAAARSFIEGEARS